MIDSPPPPASLRLITAHLPHHYQAGRALFQEYATTLPFDLTFQHFDDELERLEKEYGSPAGALLLVCTPPGSIVGCVGIRALEDTIAELKRMYIQPRYRGQGLGARLLHQSLAVARELGYTRLRLDTLPSMNRALDLYQQAGFYEIPPYRFNPLPGAKYLEVALAD